MFTCVICEQQFEDDYKGLEHLHYIHTERYHCPFQCGMSFNDKDKYISHVDSTHIDGKFSSIDYIFA